MATLASQSFVNGVWTLTPAEPAALQLAVVGLAMVATYAVVTSWRPSRTTVAAKAQQTLEQPQSTKKEKIRRAA